MLLGLYRKVSHNHLNVGIVEVKSSEKYFLIISTQNLWPKERQQMNIGQPQQDLANNV